MSAKRMPAAELRSALERAVEMLEHSRNHCHAKAAAADDYDPSRMHLLGMQDGVEIALNALHVVTRGEFGRDLDSWGEPDPMRQLGESAGAGTAGGAV
ncbi:hypothetical protein [Amycolatopsis alkalitolerans]|uniref:Uncharacterized protein n=1 Tax=Amycolatopsis alkalitolerans TaxID=2547244 RepID=A0A5C4LTP0_9PSEU|nr:hypothetical protein [Amycolatopsis alkalitolerans]TNC20892.1 hypothetical protein FG385_29860 [Amycolatopsis alkalitolerans]